MNEHRSDCGLGEKDSRLTDFFAYFGREATMHFRIFTADQCQMLCESVFFGLRLKDLQDWCARSKPGDFLSLDGQGVFIHIGEKSTASLSMTTFGKLNA